MPDYGNDRVTKNVVHCPNCKGNHNELEFKKMFVKHDDAPGSATHRGRCPKSHSWLYLTLVPR